MWCLLHKRYTLIAHIYCFRRQASQNFYQGFVHLLSCAFKEFTTSSHKQRVPCTGRGHVLKVTILKSHVTACWLVAEAASVVPDVLFRTGEDSRWLPTVIFCHIIADVTSCVTRCKEAFNIERPNLRIDTDERTLDIMGSVVDYIEDEWVCVWGGVLLWRRENE